MTDRANTLLRGRLERLERSVGRTLPQPEERDQPLSSDERGHLLSNAIDLYINELAWENLTDEEQLEGGPITHLAFPGLLAFVRGLLLAETMPDSLAPADPRPEVVSDVLEYLADRVITLQEDSADPADAAEDGHRSIDELAMTDHLIDLVLFEYVGLGEDEIRKVEDETPGA